MQLMKPKKPRGQKEVSLSEYATQSTPGQIKPQRVLRSAVAAAAGAQTDGSDPGETTTIPLPDEDALERVRRKRNAKRTGGRASTVLTDDERLGG